jgi:hypothetical protein
MESDLESAERAESNSSNELEKIKYENVDFGIRNYIYILT